MDQSACALGPAELRGLAHRILQTAKLEADPTVKRGLAVCAYSMSQIAECMELRQGAAPS